MQKKSLNGTFNVKIFSKIIFNAFGSYMPFYREWQLALFILSGFPGIRKRVHKKLCKKSLNVPNVKIFSKIIFNAFGSYMPFYREWQLALFILSDFPGIRNLSEWPQQPQWPQWPKWPLQPYFTKKLTDLDVSISPASKITYPSLLMRDGSSKSTFLFIFGTLTLWGCGGQRSYFSLNWRVIA